MLETRTIKVSPAKEEQATEQYLYFGWKLHTRQEINGQKISGSGTDFLGDDYTEFQSYHYISLTFQRDKDMPYYRRLVELEAQHNTIIASTPKEKPWTYPITLAISILGIVGYFFNHFFLIIAILGIGLHIFAWKKHKEKTALWKHDADSQLEKIYQECDWILSPQQQKTFG